MMKIFIIYLIIINLTGFLIMFIDKNRAIHKEWRIPEKNLIGISIIGGSIGMLLGMNVFRHKTKHLKFTIGIPLILIIQITAAIYLMQL
ncbi:DUF1294 domain-containing protein [Clostridium sp. SM-530-WT-3G]|uniref:DUF1294 domain-containing protein n=1 Tax=Clostridium sp. SM-530-WT-3G TaxID=2725303 RepID=UPI00145E00CD|nr:DUF1294 domain-containing protein [Clostridium sp. SM-530-WT-3G]